MPNGILLISLACCGSGGHKESDTTEWLNWTELNSTIADHFSWLIPKIVNIHSCHCLFDHFQFSLIHRPSIPGFCAMLFFTVSDFTSITSHIHSWVLFSLWLHLFNVSGVISPLFSSSILGTYRPGEFIFQCHIFLPFQTVHEVLKARILKWFVIPFSSGRNVVRTLYHVPSILSCSTWHGS